MLSHGDNQDPVDWVRELIEHTLPLLLRLDSSDAEDLVVAQAFAVLLTPDLAALLAERAEAEGGHLARAVASVLGALDHIHTGAVTDARGELITARGALLARRSPAAPRPDPACAACRLASPQWVVTVRTAIALPDPSLRFDEVLLCDGCLRAIGTTSTDDELVDALGGYALPRSLRRIHDRLAGPPHPWPPAPPSGEDTDQR